MPLRERDELVDVKIEHMDCRSMGSYSERSWTVNLKQLTISRVTRTFELRWFGLQQYFLANEWISREKSFLLTSLAIEGGRGRDGFLSSH